MAGLELPGTDVRVVDVDNQPLEETINGAVYLKYTYSDNSGDMKTLGILLGDSGCWDVKKGWLNAIFKKNQVICEIVMKL